MYVIRRGMSRDGNNKLVGTLLLTGLLGEYLSSCGLSPKEIEENPYSLENEVNYEQKMIILNDYYEDTRNRSVITQLNAGLFALLEGSINDVFLCFNLIDAQLDIEARYGHPSIIRKSDLLSKIEKVLALRKEELSENRISIWRDYDGSVENLGQIIVGKLKR